MIVGLGIDILDNQRVERELPDGRWPLRDGVYTAGEIDFCSACRKPALRYAECFAAKEAALKALGITVPDVAIFREVEVLCGREPERSEGEIPQPKSRAQRGICVGQTEPRPDSLRVVLHDRPEQLCARLGARRIWLTTTSAGRQTSAMVILES
jgi:phosphopantetheinyl transferase (holo-ACP synthase)